LYTKLNVIQPVLIGLPYRESRRTHKNNMARRQNFAWWLGHCQWSRYRGLCGVMSAWIRNAENQD
jgi:hypothetical protein